MNYKKYINRNVYPQRSQNDLIKLARLSGQTRAMSSADVLGLGLALPDASSFWHVFSARAVKSTLLTVVATTLKPERCSWVSLGDYVPIGVLGYVHTECGLVCSMADTFVLNRGGQETYVAVKHRDLVWPPLPATPVLYLRLINIRAGSTSEWSGSGESSAADLVAHQALIASTSNRDQIRIVVDGKVANGLVALSGLVGRAVDVVIDHSIKKITRVPLSAMPRFISTLHGCEKFLIPPTDLDPDVINLATTEVIIYDKTADQLGLLLTHIHPRSMNLVTHNVLSVPADTVVKGYRTLLDDRHTDNIHVKVTQRDYFVERTLIAESNLLAHLYDSTLTDVVSHLIGSDLPEWGAAVLENSLYCQALKHRLDLDADGLAGLLGYEGLRLATGTGLIKVLPIWHQQGIPVLPVGVSASGQRFVLLTWDYDGGFLRSFVGTLTADRVYVNNLDTGYVTLLIGNPRTTAGHYYAADNDFEHRFIGSTSVYSQLECGKWVDALGWYNYYDGLITRNAPTGEPYQTPPTFIYNRGDIVHRSFTLTAHQGTWSFAMPAGPLAPKHIYLMVGKASLVRGVDYTVSEDRCTIINIGFIHDALVTPAPTASVPNPLPHIPVLLVACGYADYATRDPDRGYVVQGVLSNDANYDADFGVLGHYIVGGRVYVNSEVTTHEGFGGGSATLPNGAQHETQESYIALTDNNPLERTEWLSRIRAIELARTAARPTPQCEHINPIATRIAVYSPIVARWVWLLLNGATPTTDVHDIIEAAGDWDTDIANRAPDLRYLELLPTATSNPGHIALTIPQLESYMALVNSLGAHVTSSNIVA